MNKGSTRYYIQRNHHIGSLTLPILHCLLPTNQPADPLTITLRSALSEWEVDHQKQTTGVPHKILFGTDSNQIYQSLSSLVVLILLYPHHGSHLSLIASWKITLSQSHHFIPTITSAILCSTTDPHLLPFAIIASTYPIQQLPNSTIPAPRIASLKPTMPPRANHLPTQPPPPPP